MKRFQFLGYIIEYSRFQKRWIVLDWDYEGYEAQIGPTHASKSAAMDWAAERSC